MKKALSLALLLTLAVPCFAEASYIGNCHSAIFHYEDCRFGSRTKEVNRVYFDTRDEAVDAGYRPCKVCKP